MTFCEFEINYRQELSIKTFSPIEKPFELNFRISKCFTIKQKSERAINYTVYELILLTHGKHILKNLTINLPNIEINV